MLAFLPSAMIMDKPVHQRKVMSMYIRSERINFMFGVFDVKSSAEYSIHFMREII